MKTMVGFAVNAAFPPWCGFSAGAGWVKAATSWQRRKAPVMIHASPTTSLFRTYSSPIFHLTIPSVTLDVYDKFSETYPVRIILVVPMLCSETTPSAGAAAGAAMLNFLRLEV